MSSGGRSGFVKKGKSLSPRKAQAGKEVKTMTVKTRVKAGGYDWGS
jgi:hypothetical protein